MKTKLLKLISIIALLTVGYLPAANAADATSGNGKYSGLLQTLNCPKDAAQYGTYTDYGYWGGGAWCGQQGKAGYWVWVSPNWYVWASKSEAADASSANGKYSGLVQTLNCPKDSAQYGAFHDYGYWGGGAWCGKQGKAGYWVWVAPNWYIWSNVNQ